MFTKRLGFAISEHRILEIISSFKDIETAKKDICITPEEFELGMKYLQKKGINMLMNNLSNFYIFRYN